MMLTVETSKLEKAFIKKFENGIGIKRLNQLTGRENTVIIRAENRSLFGDKSNVSINNQLNMRTISTDNYQGTTSKKSEVKLRECNDILAKLIDDYLKSNKTCDIHGLHVFLEDEALASRNVQKRSVIFVANKDVARKEGAHFNIPGALINLIYVNSQENESKFEFTADTIVKPLTLVVGEYTLHIDICCKISPDNITHRTITTQTTVDYSQNTPSKSEISSDISKCNIPQNSTLHDMGTQTEIDHFDGTPQGYREYISDEQLSDGEFAKLFNPKASKKNSTENSQSTTKEDFVRVLFACDEYNGDLRCQENRSIGNVSERKSENSIKTFDSHTGISTYNFSGNSIPQSLSSCENVDTIKEQIIAKQGIVFHNYSNQMLNKRSKSEDNQVSAGSSGRCSRGTKSNNLCLDNPDETLIKRINSNKTKTLKGINRLTANRSSSDISLHQIKRQLGDVVTSLNQLNSFVHMIDFSQKSSRKENKHGSSDDGISKFKITNQYKQVSDDVHDNKEINQNQSINSLCDRCGSFYSVGNSVNRQSDQWHIRHGRHNLEGVEPHSNKLHSLKKTHSYTSSEKEDSILSNTTENECKTENLDSFINITCLDTMNSSKTRLKKQIHGLTTRNTPNISKSTVIIHYNDKYQNCESTKNSLTFLQKNKKGNAPTPAKVGNKKTLLSNIGEINNTLIVPKTTKSARSTSEELLNVMIDQEVYSKQINNGGNSFKLNKTKEPVSSWSSSFRYSTLKLLRRREPIQFYQLSKSLPTQQNSDTSKNTEKFRFQHITNLVKAQFHKHNGPSFSSKTLHIVPSQSTTESALCIDQTYKSISNVEMNNSVHSLNHNNSKKQTTKFKKSVSNNIKHINSDSNNKHTEFLSNRDARTIKNKKWIFF